MRDAGHRTPDAGHRTSDIGHRTTDIGHRTSDGEKSKNNISTPQGGGHNKIESCVSNNGYFSKYFELSTGIRQGCLISALLFILVAEVMAIKIRNDEKVCGIKFRNIEYKICQLADDTRIFVKDTDSIIQLLSVMKKFQNCSGLKINVEKTEVISVGIYKFKN